MKKSNKIIAVLLALVMMLTAVPMMTAGATETEPEAPAHVHAFEKTAEVKADCKTETNGSATYTCECGDSYIDDYVDATGHADKDGNGYCDADNELLDPTVECECNCHKSGISKFFFNFILFFQRLFGANKECACGVAHY